MTHRRQILGASLALAAAGLLSPPSAIAAAPAGPRARVRRGGPGWPTASDWDGLKQAVGGRLAPIAAPDLSDPAVKKELSNPFFVGDQPGLTQSTGWLGAWQSTPGAYVVAAESAADVAAAIRFARAHNLRLIVRGGAHSYLGCSNAPDSLMIWTRRMRQVEVSEAFTPQGVRGPAVPAVTLGAGCIWLDAYKAVTTGAGRYVQGGGCTTVGCAGLVQGGGFGSHSKAFGTVAGSLLEAQIVTADGRTRLVNAANEPELFWALKGGGGGTYGVITRLTLATHELPANFGGFRLAIQAKSDEAYRRLLARFLDHYRTNLHTPHWGEQVQTGPSNRFSAEMVFQGLSAEQARAAWAPLTAWCDEHPGDYEGQKLMFAIPIPARHFWDAPFLKANGPPGIIRTDDRPGASPDSFWWSGDGEQVGAWWHAYASVWLPDALMQPANQGRFADAWFAATRQHSIGFHFNKGLSGGDPAGLARSRQTATNPQVLDAFALAIIASAGPPVWPGSNAPSPSPNPLVAKIGKAKVDAAIAALRAAAPGAGAYVNECDFFQPDWQQAFWGGHYARLLAIKRRYDPTGLFTVHHGVGSEAWSEDGFSRRT
jgi:FAD/FMN-containing dehydrogenase